MNKYIIFLGLILSSCSSHNLENSVISPENNASLHQYYYSFKDDVKVLYGDKIFSFSQFKRKYNISSFKDVSVITDKDKINSLTKDKNCRAVLKIEK